MRIDSAKAEHIEQMGITTLEISFASVHRKRRFMQSEIITWCMAISS